MSLEIKIPSVGESVQEAILAEWYKKDGETVEKDEPILVIETDKVTLEVTAEASGVLKITVAEGETVAVGQVVGSIETGGAPAEKPVEEKKAEQSVQQQPEKAEAEKAPAKALEKAPEPAPEKPEKAPATAEQGEKILSPSVRQLAKQRDVELDAIEGTGPGGRVTKGDVLLYLERSNRAMADKVPEQPVPAGGLDAMPSAGPEEKVTRKAMTPIRRRIAERLLAAKHGTAMLTTFNDVDMSAVMALRSRYKDDFKKRHGVSLGFMSFFLKASIEALKEFPQLNAFIDGTDVVLHEYYHIGVAVGSPRGLVVPVIRHADRLSFADLEKAIVDFVGKIKENRLTISDMEGGTFTITNGGVFGSLLSTPILNTPQSGILGMHRIEKRPVVVNDEIVARPMMYLAMSYDHRIVDGREAVTFLRRIKECIEDPQRIMMEV